jgi:RNA polymerase sigma factor (sigma-70 family)
MPIPRPVPLTTDQQSLASDPRSLKLAADIAGRFARSFPRLAEDLRSEAFLALCTAARTFEPHRQVSFPTHATSRIHGAMLDLCRGLEPQGYRRRYRRRDTADAPYVGSLDVIRAHDDTGQPLTLHDFLASDEDPADWGAEYQDELAQLSRSLPPRDGVIFRLLYGHAETARMRVAAYAVGLSESRVSQIHALAISVLEEATL